MNEELLALMQQNYMQMMQNSMWTGRQGGMGISGAPLNPTSGFPGPSGFGVGRMPAWMGGFGDILQYPLSVASMAFSQMASAHGFTPAPIFGRYDYYDMIRNQAETNKMMASIQSGAAADTRWLGTAMTNMAISAAAPGTDLVALEQSQRVSAAAYANVGGTALRFFMGVPGLLGSPMVESTLGYPFGNQFMAAHTYMAGRQFIRSGVQGVGFTPDEVGTIAGGMGDYFTRADRLRMDRAQGFNLAELGGIYEQAARRGLMQSPDQAESAIRAMGLQATPDRVLGRLSTSANEGVSELAKTLAVVAEIVGPGMSMQQLFENLEKITSSPIRQIGPQRARQMLQNMKEVSRVTGIGIDNLEGLVSGTMAMGQMYGTTGPTALRVSAYAAMGEMGYRNATGGQFGPEMMTPQQFARRYQEEGLASVESNMSTVVANLIDYSKRTGAKLTPDLQELVRVYTSPNPDVYNSQAARDIRGKFSTAEKVVAAFGQATGSGFQTARATLYDMDSANRTRSEIVPDSAIMARVEEFERRFAPSFGLNTDFQHLASATHKTTKDVVGVFMDRLRRGVGQDDVAVQDIARSLGTNDVGAVDQAFRVIKERANSAAVLEGQTGARNGFEVFRLLGGARGAARLSRTADIGGAISTFVRTQTNIGMSDGVLGRFVDAALDPDTKSLGTRIMEVAGQTRISDWFSTASDDEVTAAALQYGIHARVGNNEMRSRTDIAAEMARAINTDLESPDLNVRLKATTAGKRFFRSENKNGIGGLLLFSDLLRQMPKNMTAAEINEYMGRHGRLMEMIGGEGFGMEVIEKSVNNQNLLKAATGMALIDVMGKGFGEAGEKGVASAVGELSQFFEKTGEMKKEFAALLGVDPSSTINIDGKEVLLGEALKSSSSDTQRKAVREIMRSVGKSGYLGPDFQANPDINAYADKSLSDLGGDFRKDLDTTAQKDLEKKKKEADDKKKDGSGVPPIISLSVETITALGNEIAKKLPQMNMVY